MTYYVYDPTLYTHEVPFSMHHNQNPLSISTNPLVSYYYGGIPHWYIMVYNPQQIYSPTTYAIQDYIQFPSVQAEKASDAESLYVARSSESGCWVSPMSLSSGTANTMANSVWNPQQIYSPTTHTLQDSSRYSPVQAETAPNGESSYESSGSESVREGEVTPMSISSGTASNMSNSEGEHGTFNFRRVRAKATSLRNRGLTLTLLLDDQHPVESLLKNFDLQFQDYIYQRDQLSLDERIGVYVVRFESIMMAQDALLLARQHGYETSSHDRRSHSLLPRRLDRPTPQRVCRFKVLAKKLFVRAGRTFDSYIRKTETENNVVFVNRIKGRRARLVKSRDENVMVGWASLFSEKGEPLMEQLE